MFSDDSSSLRVWFRRLLLLFGIILLIPVLSLVGCQSSLIYFPRPYGTGMVEQWQKDTSGKTVDFTTSQGRQRAFLQGNLKSPRNLWILCGGNGTVALDWSDWIAAHAPKEDAWLLVDFPGYGDCEGKPNPDRIRENLKTAVPLAWQACGLGGEPDPGKLRFFGHSLGAAACMMGASEFKIQRGILLSPFTSTMDMSRQVTGLPLGFLVWHRFDNSARLAELAARGPGKVVILHSEDDAIIPISMSRRLAETGKDVVKLIELPTGGHNQILQTDPQAVGDALREIGGE
ncbi:alpha/beta hydrolase [Luteolibacter yonseiensis]|uniref:Alpha/beta hydrolase n=1 Tax=Luteolibacter yonseiensis TaxID=1144680 RepID=A0A934QZX3_9BACT|nr:alpha/beta hydrolase [Luteolibacter yonseiensis]MBK1814169.1 alpha/beta hydrolase [Luteolibacter yonseiensis]